MFEGKIIPGYRHQPGFHCASSAIRNVLAHRGVQVNEPAVIGLGRGPGFFHLISENTDHPGLSTCATPPWRKTSAGRWV